jgi:hypothetical protein
MRTLTALLGRFDEEKAARFRGLVLGQLMRAARGPHEPGLVHLFLLPPGPGQTRFSIYETTQPLNLEVPVPEAIRQALHTLHQFECDPRVVPGAGQTWRDVDAQQAAFYLGTGARFAYSGPNPAATTIARLVDHTAFYFSLDEWQRPVVLEVSAATILNDAPFPITQEVRATREPPFVLVDTIVGFLR